jgi:NADH-quinone oxidoreductase subunit C
MEEKTLIELLKQRFAGKVEEVLEISGDTVLIIDRESLLGLMTALKDQPFEFNMLLDLTCVDYLGREPRFEMVYHLFSLPRTRRLRIKVRLDERDLAVDSITSLWKNANWLEREVYDMFGVLFRGHPDLRRLLTYDEFEGYPLRKEYPLRKRQPIIPMRK